MRLVDIDRLPKGFIGGGDFVGYVAVSRIDNLTKEMAGDSDA